MENELETTITVRIQHFSEPKTVLQSQINGLADQYKKVFETLKKQYEDVLAQTKDIGTMMGADLQTLD